MSISKSEAEQVAQLARLALSNEELEVLARELSSILAHVEELEAAELGGEAREFQTAEGPAPLPEDDPKPDPLERGPAAFAPEWADGFFTVPRLAALDGGGGEAGGEAG